MNSMMSGWLTSGRSTSRSTAIGQDEHDDHGQAERHAGRHALFVEPDQSQRREHHHDALREVEHAGRLEDQHEAERDQRVEHAGDEAVPQGLDQRSGAAAICTNGSMKI